jgi:diketogulonate reductase-like aldo/keto reductase
MSSSAVATLKLPAGREIPVLGQGTWGMGEDVRRRSEEIAALKLGLELGMNMIDTAEMYGEGAAEELVGEAIAGVRDEVFLVTKLLPSNASTYGAVEACERSLRRLKTDWIDLYLLHWRGNTPLENTVDAFGRLVRSGKIRYWGVSNFDVADMEELIEIPSASKVQTDQVLYNLTRRGIEYDLLPWCRNRGIPIMAYSPIEQGHLLTHPVVQKIAARHGAISAQVALAWVLRQDKVSAIPKSANRMHVIENRDALSVSFTEQDLAELDRAFLPPSQKKPLEMI